MRLLEKLIYGSHDISMGQRSSIASAFLVFRDIQASNS